MQLSFLHTKLQIFLTILFTFYITSSGFCLRTIYFQELQKKLSRPSPSNPPSFFKFKLSIFYSSLFICIEVDCENVGINSV